MDDGRMYSKRQFWKLADVPSGKTFAAQRKRAEHYAQLGCIFFAMKY